MSGDKRQTWGLIIDVIEVLEKHDYKPFDNQHTGRAVLLIGDLAHIYEGTQEEPGGGYVVPSAEPRQADPTQAEPPPADSGAAIAGRWMLTIVNALGEASSYQHDRAARCANCANQSCKACEHHLDTARVYENLASRLQHTLDGTAPQRPPPEPAADPLTKRSQLQNSAEPEAE